MSSSLLLSVGYEVAPLSSKTLLGCHSYISLELTFSLFLLTELKEHLCHIWNRPLELTFPLFRSHLKALLCTWTHLHQQYFAGAHAVTPSQNVALLKVHWEISPFLSSSPASCTLCQDVFNVRCAPPCWSTAVSSFRDPALYLYPFQPLTFQYDQCTVFTAWCGLWDRFLWHYDLAECGYVSPLTRITHAIHFL